MQSDASKRGSTFLKYLLLSQPVQQRIHAKGTRATVNRIKASLLKTIEISFEAQCLASLYRRKLAALEALKKSLLHQAFSGAL